MTISKISYTMNIINIMNSMHNELTKNHLFLKTVQ